MTVLRNEYYVVFYLTLFCQFDMDSESELETRDVYFLTSEAIYPLRNIDTKYTRN